jgi:aryl-alcohol dehydrogenase-like predicted oxidoreductase
MNYKQLGTSDLKISTIGFGCMSLKNDPDENQRLLHTALDYGIYYFDTADLYDKGMNETGVGKALKAKRDKVILATKVGNRWREDGSGWDWNPTKEYIMSAVEGSLKRLQTDYIDLYQLHGGTLEDPFEETLEAFENLQRQGKIRYYGISSIRPNVIKRFAEQSKIVSVMLQYSLLDRRPEEYCLSFLQQKNIGVLTRGSVAGGLLVNKPARPYLNYDEHQVQQAATAIRNLSGAHRTAAQTALQYVLENPAVTSAVVGIRAQHQLDDAVGTLTAPLITNDEKERMRNSVEINYYKEHRE